MPNNSDRPPLGALLTSLEFSLTDAVGGWRGLVESVAPGLVFVVIFTITRTTRPALIGALAVAAVAVLLRLVQRQRLEQALSGLLGVVIGVVWAATSGRSENFFAGGLLANVGYAVVTVISILVRWPLVGVVVELFRNRGMGWRNNPGVVRRYALGTWLLAGMFLARLAVQVPLYFAGNTVALGTAKLAMGVPLTVLTLWLVWLVVRSADVAVVPDQP
jgi:hypothetical protein